MQLNNITRNYPDVMPDGPGVQYFISEDGKDFYKSMKYFKKKYKLLIGKNNIVLSCAEDVSTLYPVGFSVVEVNELPDDFDTLGGWLFENGSVIPYIPYYINKAELNRQKLITDANSQSVDLKTALILGDISEEDTAKLKEIIACVAELKALEFTTIVNNETLNAFAWPEIP